MAELPQPVLPRLRQAVVAASDLDAVAAELHARLGLGEPYADPGVGHFGLRNAVFALGDTFLEVVSPVRADASAARLIERRGGDCGYMLMFQLAELESARSRVAEQGVREVFEVALDDVSEVHLHPADIQGAIVALTEPHPPGSWAWGGPGWQERSVPLEVVGATVEVPDVQSTIDRWQSILNEPPGLIGVAIREGGEGLTEIVIDGLATEFESAGVRFRPSDYEEE